jgi:CBS domain-containing protein
MLVQEVMNTDVVVAAPDTPALEVARLMAEHGVGTVVIVEDDRLIGIVTDRDIVLQHVAKDYPPGRSIRDAMTRGDPASGLVTIAPDMDLLDAAWEMGRQRVGRLPVVEDGRLVGILSAGDVARELHRALDGLLAEGEKAAEG